MNVVIRTLGAPATLLVVLGAGLTGCGQEGAPGDEVPALASALDQVDTAVEAENYDKARSAVEFLLTETRRAHQDGELSREDADRIRTAARAVLTNLPETQEPQDEPTPESDETTSEDRDEDKDEDEEKPGKPEKDGDKPGKGNDSDDD